MGHLFIEFNKYFLNVKYVVSTLLLAADTLMNKTGQVLVLKELIV
jgi:hypothetical protein